MSEPVNLKALSERELLILLNERLFNLTKRVEEIAEQTDDADKMVRELKTKFSVWAALFGSLGSIVASAVLKALNLL
jgi:hypothetical protein